MTHGSARPRRGRKIFWGILIGIGVLLLVSAGAVAWNVFAKLGQIETIEDAFPDETLRPAPAEVTEGEDAPINILLLGSDSRADSSDSLLSDLGNRADTIIVAHISGDRETVTMMSIMRDSWIDVPGHGEMKINGALAYGGMPLMVQTVEGLLDQRIDHVAMIDFAGFQGMTDALGGVTVHNPNAFSAQGHDFPKGAVTLNGEEALAFVRERSSFQDGDYQRVENQQLFLKSIVDQTLSRGTLTDPVKLNNVLGAVTPYVATDSSLNFGKMLELGQSMISLKSSNITSFTMPTNGTGTIGGQSVVHVNWDELEVVREHFANDTLHGYQPPAKP